MTDLKELKKLLAEALPTPWKALSDDGTFDIASDGIPENEDRYAWIGEVDEEPNAALIVAAVNALPELLAKVKRYEAALNLVQENVEASASSYQVRVETISRVVRAALKETG